MTASPKVPDLVQRWAAAKQHHDAALLGGRLAADFVGICPFGFVLPARIAREASVAMTQWPAAASSLLSRPLPQPSSRTMPARDRTGSRYLKIPGAQGPDVEAEPRGGEPALDRGGNWGFRQRHPRSGSRDQ